MYLLHMHHIVRQILPEAVTKMPNVAETEASSITACYLREAYLKLTRSLLEAYFLKLRLSFEKCYTRRYASSQNDKSRSCCGLHIECLELWCTACTPQLQTLKTPLLEIGCATANPEKTNYRGVRSLLTTLLEAL
jgi:hypothetical protein